MKKLTRTLPVKTLTAATALLATNTSVFAHPGHPLVAEPFEHLLTSPFHLLVLALGGGVLLLGARFAQQLATKRRLQFTGVATLGIAIVLTATHLLN